MFWFWFFTGPAMVLALAALRQERGQWTYFRRRLSEQINALPPASVIVPVRGYDEGLRENLQALAALDYPDYELLVVAREAADIPPGVLPHRAKIVLAHGADPHTGEKVQNLAAAVRATRKRSQIFAFADSDGCVTRRWLRALAAPLAEEGVGAATGYRWFLPERPRFWALLRAVWDAVPAGMLGSGDNRFAWGGAMALRKETFFEARLLEHWKHTVSDDYALAAAIHAAGLSIAYAPGALVPCLDSICARRFFAWTRRQMLITRIYNPRLWWPGLAAHFFYCGGMAASVAAIWSGRGVGIWTLAAQLLPGMVKGLRRAARARAALPEYAGWFRRFAWVYAAGAPLATWMWLIAMVSSSFGDTIEWRGYRYELKARGV
ncbi:MAG TPA: glycosyltransferase [Bryobacteraceae bacterium]|nr:glycosyltransferase [Bryobacteraceae bacterium]